MLTILLSIGLIAVFAILMSVGLIIRGKELKGTCASQNSLLNEGETCGMCGQAVGSCDN